jgi:hypothetical protein
MKYLSNIIKYVSSVIHKHRWRMSVPCPDNNIKCQVYHFIFLSEKEALEYSKSNYVSCWDCNEKYN